MVLGYGAKGGQGRCYQLWTDFMKCMSDAGVVSPDVCQNSREDYFECLHRKKMVSSSMVLHLTG